MSGDQSLRTLAKEYELHHSSIDEIRKDAQNKLTEHFDHKSAAMGRPRNTTPEESEEMKQLRAQNEQFMKERAIAIIQRDFAELKLKHERDRSDKERKNKHLKKKKKRT